jgi:hypothetical protein
MSSTPVGRDKGKIQKREQIVGDEKEKDIQTGINVLDAPADGFTQAHVDVLQAANIQKRGAAGWWPRLSGVLLSVVMYDWRSAGIVHERRTAS